MRILAPALLQDRTLALGGVDLLHELAEGLVVGAGDPRGLELQPAPHREAALGVAGVDPLVLAEGRLELDGDTLAEAIAQLNRANQVQIVIADPSLAGEELHGAFRMNDPRGFAQAVAISLDTAITERDGQISLGS